MNHIGLNERFRLSQFYAIFGAVSEIFCIFINYYYVTDTSRRYRILHMRCVQRGF